MSNSNEKNDVLLPMEWFDHADKLFPVLVKKDEFKKSFEKFATEVLCTTTAKVENLSMNFSHMEAVYNIYRATDSDVLTMCLEDGTFYYMVKYTFKKGHAEEGTFTQYEHDVDCLENSCGMSCDYWGCCYNDVEACETCKKRHGKKNPCKKKGKKQGKKSAG